MSRLTEFLQAFVENSNAAGDGTLHPLMGPNGTQVWTAGVGADRRLAPSIDPITVTDVPDELAVPRPSWRGWHGIRPASA